MRIRCNDINNDWRFGHSETDFFVDNNQAVAQDLKTKILEWKNDFFANLEAGIDWRNRLGQRGQKDLLDEDIQKIITNSDEVIALTQYRSSLIDRQCDIEFECYTLFSERAISIALSIEGE